MMLFISSILGLGSFIIIPSTWFGIRDYIELPKVFFFTCLVICGLNTATLSSLVDLLRKRNMIIILLCTHLLIQIFASLLWSVDFEQSLWGQPYRYQGIFTQIALVSFCLGCYVVLHNRDNRSRLIHIITASHLLHIVILVLNAAWVLGSGLQILNLRVSGTLGNPNFAAAYLVLTYPLAHQSLMHRFSRGNKIIWHLLILIALIATQSRIGLITFIICSALINRHALINRSSFYARFITYGALLSLILTVAISLTRYSSFDNRVMIWNKAISAIYARPQGYGTENFHQAFQSQLSESDFDLKKIRVDKAHNELLEIGTTGGFLNIGVWILLQYFLISRIRLIDRATEKNHLTIYWIGYVLLAAVSVFSLSSYVLMYFMIALVISDPIIDEIHDKKIHKNHTEG